MSYILAFIHIKKTGGISLQKVLAKQYGKKFFGGHTHSALKKVAAVNPVEKDGLRELSDGSCVCKHWTYNDYAPIHGRAKFVTVLRDPVDRICSHYNFYLKHHPKGQSFDEYIHNSTNINIYSRSLPADPTLLSEIYLFHDLQGSINRSKIIRSSKVPHTNKTLYRYSVTSEEREVFNHLNDDDIQFYRKCLKYAI